MFLEKHVSLQGNNQVTDKELSRKCILSNKRITLLLFDCYSFVIRLIIEEQSNNKCKRIEKIIRLLRGNNRAVTRLKRCYHGQKTKQRTIADWEAASIGHNGL